jgi:hypothetical protein
MTHHHPTLDEQPRILRYTRHLPNSLILCSTRTSRPSLLVRTVRLLPSRVLLPVRAGDELRVEEHAPDGVEGDGEEVVEEKQRFGSEGREEGDGASDGLTAKLKVFEAAGAEDFEVVVYERRNRKRGGLERDRQEETGRCKRTISTEEIVESDGEDVDDGGEVLSLPVPALDGRSVDVPVVKVGQSRRRRKDASEMDAVVESDRHSSCEGLM